MLVERLLLEAHIAVWFPIFLKCVLEVWYSLSRFLLEIIDNLSITTSNVLINYLIIFRVSELRSI